MNRRFPRIEIYQATDGWRWRFIRNGRVRADGGLWLLLLPLAAAAIEAIEATLRWLERRATRFANVTGDGS